MKKMELAISINKNSGIWSKRTIQQNDDQYCVVFDVQTDL
jgi:hypothetical protein